MSIKGIKHKTLLREKIYDMLKEAIINGEIKPGERIVETKLARDIGISRTPIREAIRLLESEGYLESVKRGGVRVTQITKEDIINWSEIKYTLNDLAVRKAVKRITYGKIKKMEEVLTKVEKLLNKKEFPDVKKIILYNEEFHQIIFEASKNKLIKNVSKEYQKYTYQMRKLLANIKGRKKQAFKEHKKILEAMKEGDKEKAVKLSRLHSENSKKVLLEKVQSE